jgi:hypothetical protein
MLMRLLGAFFPNTLAGTMEGNPRAIDESAENFTDFLRKRLLFI